jgi:TetR/AcrR family transcriptional regulator, transcriptional repressor for nem operon
MVIRETRAESLCDAAGADSAFVAPVDARISLCARMSLPAFLVFRCKVDPVLCAGTTSARARKGAAVDHTPQGFTSIGHATRPRISKRKLVLTDIRVRSYSLVVRYSPEHKAENHDKILSTAARSFREHGADGSGIGMVMKKVGLTKGGFYRHFESKDDLFVEAVARALDEMAKGTLEVAKSAPEGQALRAIIERYLSTRHANSPGMGCVIAALGAEFARKPPAVRQRIEALLDAYRERLLPFIPGKTREEKLSKCVLLFASMAGVLTRARVISAPDRRERMLADARKFFVESFVEQ